MRSSTNKLVTIGLPIHRRLQHLPHILKIVAAQDYPAIELLVSDNGMNGTRVREIVEAHYSRNFRFRQNPDTVDIARHFNQMIEDATGEYFVMLCDDDEISRNYVSELVRQLERHPQAVIAFARQENIDENGVITKKSSELLPESLSGPDFIHAIWGRYEFGFDLVATFLARTEAIKACGGYPDLARGSHIENVLVTKLCLNSHVVFSSDCVFRWRVIKSSFGWSGSVDEFATATRGFLEFLKTDPVILRFISDHPVQGRDMRNSLVQMAWETYLYRLRNIYNTTLSPSQWIKAAFALPFILSYYRSVAQVLIHAAKNRIKTRWIGQLHSSAQQPE